MKATVRWLDALTARSGEGLAWLMVSMVLLQGAVVFMRYVFGLSILWMQEAILYLHAILFLCGAGYTLLHDAHVRVDVLYSPASPRTKAIVDLIGVTFFLMPLCALIFWAGTPYVVASWKVLEGSMEPSGIPAVFLLKTCILLFAVGLAVQGTALALRAILVLRGERDASAVAHPDTPVS